MPASADIRNAKVSNSTHNNNLCKQNLCDKHANDTCKKVFILLAKNDTI